MSESIKTNVAKSNTTARPATKAQKSFFQPKLRINQPNDVYEQEADAVADKVMRMPDTTTMDTPFFQPSIPVISRKCEHCEEEKEEERRMQRKEGNGEESRIIMNDGAPVIQRSCTQDFSGYTGTTCRGTIQVGATTISSPIIGYYHLFILYTDSTGAQFYLRGGPGNPVGGGYGNIIVLCEPYVERQIEYDSRNVLEQVYEGDDACNKLTTMQQRLNEIESWNIAYVPAGPNSNSVIATLLRAAGLPLRKPAVPTPGFEMEVTPTGNTLLPQDRPTLFLISLGGGNGFLLNAEVQQRLYTFSPVIGGGIPIPIPLELSAGLYSFPDQRRVGGSLGLGTDISLINLPLPVFSPLGIVVGGGLTAGAVESTDTTGATRTDPEVGGYVRAGLYTDISRFRISPLYQYNNIFNTTTGTSTSEHSFVVQLGYTF